MLSVMPRIQMNEGMKIRKIITPLHQQDSYLLDLELVYT